MSGITIDLTDGPRLTPSEDAVLRRLCFFETSGATLSQPMRVMRAELRARDRRTTVREPEIAARLVPVYS
jgi:hypothetical protein